jgi:hypothetical protein
LDPEFWQAAAELRLLVAERDHAVQQATGRLPLYSSCDPIENLRVADRYLDYRDTLWTLLAIDRMGLRRRIVRELPTERPAKCSEILALYEQSTRERRAEQARRAPMPGA